MIAQREWLDVAVDAATKLARRHDDDPIKYLRWLPLQHSFLLSPAHLKQIRAGNQGLGKTTAALSEVISRCLGRHVLGLPTRNPPVTWWIICSSWSQSVDIQKKLWELLPKGELDPRTTFDEINGFSPTKRPAVRFKNGSIIKIKTAKQQTIDMAGATLTGGALFDEPPKSERLFNEVVQRVEEYGGIVLLSYTPVNAPTDYLRAKCEQGVIKDFWSRLTPEALIPVGATEPLRTADGRPKDERYIARRERKVSDYERDVVIHGDWEFRAQGRYFTVFRDGGQDSHVHVVDDRIPDDVMFALGADHGSRPGKQIFVLLAVWISDDGCTHVYVLDEYVDTLGTATPADDAEGLIAMLARHDLEWGDLADACGDRIHMKGTGSQKSNKDLFAQVCKRLRVPMDVLKPILRGAKTGEGRGGRQVESRSRWLFHRMLEKDGFGVHPRCSKVRESLNKYDLTDNDDKDAIDAIVYGVDRWIYSRKKTVFRPIQFSR